MERRDGRLGIGLVGSGFMGRSHAFAFNAAAQVFDLPLKPELAVLADQRRDAGGRGGATAGLCPSGRRLARAGRRSGGRCRRDHRAERPAQADRAGRACRGQGRLLREAARRRRSPTRARWRRPRATSGGVTLVGFQYLKNPMVGARPRHRLVRRDRRGRRLPRHPCRGLHDRSGGAATAFATSRTAAAC